MASGRRHPDRAAWPGCIITYRVLGGAIVVAFLAILESQVGGGSDKTGNIEGDAVVSEAMTVSRILEAVYTILSLLSTLIFSGLSSLRVLLRAFSSSSEIGFLCQSPHTLHPHTSPAARNVPPQCSLSPHSKLTRYFPSNWGIHETW